MPDANRFDSRTQNASSRQSNWQRAYASCPKCGRGAHISSRTGLPSRQETATKPHHGCTIFVACSTWRSSTTRVMRSATFCFVAFLLFSSNDQACRWRFLISKACSSPLMARYIHPMLALLKYEFIDDAGDGVGVIQLCDHRIMQCFAHILFCHRVVASALRHRVFRVRPWRSGKCDGIEYGAS